MLSHRTLGNISNLSFNSNFPALNLQDPLWYPSVVFILHSPDCVMPSSGCTAVTCDLYFTYQGSYDSSPLSSSFILAPWERQRPHQNWPFHVCPLKLPHKLPWLFTFAHRSNWLAQVTKLPSMWTDRGRVCAWDGSTNYQSDSIHLSSAVLFHWGYTAS